MLGRLRNLKYMVFPALSTLGFLGSLSFASVPQWDSHEQVQKFHTDHLKDDKTVKHIVDQNHEIRVSPEQLKTLSKYIQSLGKVETTSLTEIPKYFRSGLSCKPGILEFTLDELKNLVFLPAERGAVITLADADLMSHLTSLIKDRNAPKKSSYSIFSNLIQQLSNRLDKSFDKIFGAKCIFRVVVDNNSMICLDIPLVDFLLRDHELAENDDKVKFFGMPANDLQCCLFPSDDWKQRQTLTTTADNPLFLRVYFSLVDELPCVLRTGIVQLDKELVPPTYQSVGGGFKNCPGWQRDSHRYSYYSRGYA